jgi:hypothetical protein
MVTTFISASASDVAVLMSGRSSWARTLLVFMCATLLALCDGVVG